MFRRRWLAVLLAAAMTSIGASQVPAPAAPVFTHWCPMHPDERAAALTACPVCRMPMVPIPPMRVGEYRLDLDPVSSATGRGLAGVRVAVRDPDRGAVVSAFETVHERLLHLFVIGRDLEYFAHLHPERIADDRFDARHPLPPGEYMLIADFVPAGGTPQLLSRAIVAPGPRRVQPSVLAMPPSGASLVAAGVRVQIEPAELTAGRRERLRFLLSSAGVGQPIVDLEPYLGAAAHLLIVSEDLTDAIHGHAESLAAIGPVMSFAVTLPRPGRYKAWLQFQRHGVVITAPMTLVAR